MPATIPWQTAETTRQVLRHLEAGECVVLPTESTYELVAHACSTKAMERLSKAIAPGEVPAIVLTDYFRLVDWLPWIRGAGERLIRKLGPGPYTLRGVGGVTQGLTARLPEITQRLVARDQRLALRWPTHSIWGELAESDMPLVAVPLPDAAKADAVCMVDAGPMSAKLPSIVESDGPRCRLTRVGGLTQEMLDAATCCRILFVCTGNTCRSPMAQALCTKLLAERLGCERSALLDQGFCVQSAGLAAMMGGDAASEAVQVAGELGAELVGHRSTPISLEMLQSADFVFAMTAGHWYTLRSAAHPGLPVPRLLSPNFEDINDPIGGSLGDYRACASQILECLQHRLPEILES